MLTFRDPSRFGRRDFLRVRGAIARRADITHVRPRDGLVVSTDRGSQRHLPLPARRAEPDRDVRSEDGGAGRDPQRHRRDSDRASRASPSAARSRSSRSWPTGSRSSARSCPATPITTSSRSSAGTRSARTSARSTRASPARTIPRPACRATSLLLPAGRRSDDAGRHDERSASSRRPARSAPATAPFVPGGGGRCRRT